MTRPLALTDRPRSGNVIRRARRGGFVMVHLRAHSTKVRHARARGSDLTRRKPLQQTEKK